MDPPDRPPFPRPGGLDPQDESEQLRRTAQRLTEVEAQHGEAALPAPADPPATGAPPPSMATLYGAPPIAMAPAYGGPMRRRQAASRGPLLLALLAGAILLSLLGLWHRLSR